MSQPTGHELLDEWRSRIDALLASAASLGGAELSRDLLKLSRHQIELMQEIVERERRLQGELTQRFTAPLDAIFDLLTEAAETLRSQAEAVEAAGRALEDAAGLMRRQSERFERTVAALRQPADLAKAAAGARRRPPKRRAQAGTAESRHRRK
jgi:hypothetical protein